MISTLTQTLRRTTSILATLLAGASLSASAATSSVPLTGLVNYWRADGTFRDSMGTTPGVAAGGVGFVNAVQNQGFSFNGIDAAVILTGDTTPLPPPWTLGFWAYRVDAPTQSSALLADNATGIKTEQFGSARQVGLTQFGVADYAFNYIIPAGVWTHIAMVASSSGTLLYANGQFAASIPQSVNLPRAAIGMRPDNGADHLSGVYDEITVQNRALTKAEIQTLIAASKANYSSPLTGRVVSKFSPGTGVPNVVVTLSMPGISSVDQIPYGVLPPNGTGTRAALTDEQTTGVPPWSNQPLSSDLFAVVYDTRYILPEAMRHYQDFELITDDGGQLWLDNAIFGTVDGSHPAQSTGALQFALDQGAHSVQVRHFNSGGQYGAALHLDPYRELVFGFGSVWIPSGMIPFTPAEGFVGRFYDLNSLEVAVTDENGYFTFSQVPPAGQFLVTAKRDQFVMESATVNASVAAGQPVIQVVSSPPTVGSIADQTIDEDGSVTVSFSVGDLETAGSSLSVQASHNNPQLLGNLSATGSGGTRSLLLKPIANANGVATVTVTVTDGDNRQVQTSFTLTVNPVDDIPVAGSQTALHFTGNKQSVSVANIGAFSGSAPEHTIEAWVRPTATIKGRQDILELGQQAPGSHIWRLNADKAPVGNLLLEMGPWDASGGFSQVTGIPIPLQQWTHLAAVWQPTENRYTVYVNGQPRGVTSPTNSPPSTFNFTSFALTLGMGPDAAFSGDIDELRVWKIALHDFQIQAGMTRPLNGFEDGLVLYWRFDESSGSTAYDTAPSGSAANGVVGTGINYAPGIFQNTNYATLLINEDTRTPIFLPGFDFESGTNLFYKLLSLPTTGTVSRAIGTQIAWNTQISAPLSYLPPTNYNGPASFTYEIWDSTGNRSSAATVQMLVVATNDPPSITAIDPIVIEEDGQSAAIAFSVSDPETLPGDLSLFVDILDRNLIPPAGVTLSGSGTNRTAVIRPAGGELGETTVIITVIDKGNLSAAASVKVRVVPKPAFAVFDLGVITGRNQSMGAAVNDLGWVAGSSDNSVVPGPSGLLYRGFETESPAESIIANAGGTSLATGLNNRGQVVGYTTKIQNGKLVPVQAFRWTDGQLKLLDNPLTTIDGTLSYGVNNDGIVVGSMISNGLYRAVQWSPAGALTAIGTLPNGTNSEALAINDAGTVVGYSTVAGGTEHAFLYNGTALTDLGLVAGHNSGRALAVNGRDHVAGFSRPSGNSVPLPFLRDGSGLRLLPLLNGAVGGAAQGLNDFDQVVGKATLSNQSTRAFYFSAGKAYDLNDLLPEDSGWVLEDARAINQAGWITGVGRIGNQTHAYLAVPAWTIGRQIARPEGSVPRPPEVDILGSNPVGEKFNSFYWSNLPLEKDRKLFAIRPVKARLKWFVSTEDVTQSGTNLVANTNRIAVVGAAVWPRDPSRHVAGTPVEVEPTAAPAFGYSWQSVEYTLDSSATVDPNSKIFAASREGYAVLRYLVRSGDAPNPAVDKPAFDVVRTHFWTNAPGFVTRPWIIGNPVTNPAHFDYGGRNGHVFFERAFYDGAGDEAAYDRISRRGAILPVNTGTARTATPTNRMVVVWYQTNRLGVAWGGLPNEYTLSWPDDTTNKIIIASTHGAGLLPGSVYQDKRVYNQPDPSLPGFNPNEEHAMLAPGESGETLFALRNDLNAPRGSSAWVYSAPFALLKYRDVPSGEWRITPFKVIAEEAPYFFRYPGEAGKLIQPPAPLTSLVLCGQSYSDGGPAWEDYTGALYARAAGPVGDTTNVYVRWFYPLQPGFYWDRNFDGVTDFVAAGDCVPWLDRRSANGSDNTPQRVEYNIRWPDQDKFVQIGQTLLTGGRDIFNAVLPDIKDQAKSEIVFNSLNPNDTNSLSNLALLYDPLTPRTIKTNVSIPDAIPRRNNGGVEYFDQLPWPLKQRLSYDPINKWLSFSGYLDEQFDVGQPLLLANVMSSNELRQVLELAPFDSGWNRTITNLFNITRNPNLVDINLDGQPDIDLRIGLITQYTVVSNRTVFDFVAGRSTNLVSTNRLFFRPVPTAIVSVIATNVVPEPFGGQPKALTAALGGVPAAAPLPGSALHFDGASQIVTSNSLALNESFTVEFWARRTDLRPNQYLVSQDDIEPTKRLRIGFRDDNAFVFQFGGYSLATPASYNDTNWHHWTCEYYSSTNGRAIFLDGSMVAIGGGGSGLPSGHLAFGANSSSNGLRGDLDEIRVWGLGRSQLEISTYASKRIKGTENGLLIYYRLDQNSGSVVLDDGPGGQLAALEGTPSWIKSTAPCGIPPRYITIAENNDPSLPGLPIALHILRIDDGPFLGDVKVLPGDNVFDQRSTFRHSSEFGGNPDPIEFEWYYRPDSRDFKPTQLPPVDPLHPDTVDLSGGWLRYTGGKGLNDLTIGKGGEAGILVLGDTWWICRYRGYNINLATNQWSGWVGDPSGSPEQPRAKLAEGWIKRVIRGLNPFDQRVADFHSSPAASYVSMIQQAGPRYVRDIAFNPSADYLNSIGLIEAYETVLTRGRNLSIDGVPAANFDPANQALLLAAGKIHDLYMVLGNEAYADAEDPTIGFGSSSTEYGSLSSSIFAFQNQLDSLMEEELVLLRGRDDSRSGVSSFPVYNRLLWNYTLAEGEVAYQQVYNIKDVTGLLDTQGRPIPDGFINEKDARVLYPQGHGDAWGHYMTALRKYYDLLRHPNFTWIPRTENVSVAGQAIEVNFQHERKFAHAAAARAKAGKEIVDLTYRSSYTEDPDGQWQGYQDTNPDRAWGVADWARRASVGAYFDWVTANALLPAADPEPAHTGIEKVDRTTVSELADIPAQMAEIQARLDMADGGLNPLGLVKGAMVFDIDPTFNAVGSTAQIGRQAVQGLGHFEQIKERAVKTLNNAARVWDEANRASQQLRQAEDSLEDFQRNYRGEEADYKNRLIEIFGYPYAGDIGPGKVFPSGYDGPDLYHYMYVDTAEITGVKAPPAASFTGYFTRLDDLSGLPGDDKSYFLGFDTASITDSSLKVNFVLQNGDYGFTATPEMGQRRAQGELQLALSDLVQADGQLKIALKDYANLVQDIQASVDLLQARYKLNSDIIVIKSTQLGVITTIDAALAIMKGVQINLTMAANLGREIGEAVNEGIPKVIGLASDALAPARGALRGVTTGTIAGLEVTAAQLEVAGNALELSKEVVGLSSDLALQVQFQEYEALQQVKQLESLIRSEVAFRLEGYKQAEVVRQAAQRYLATLAQGQRVVKDMVGHRRSVAAQITENRYQDMTFRIFQNDAIQKYRSTFDLAARYCYLASTVYDYETSFLGSDPRAGRRFMNDIIRQRALGQLVEGGPVIGAPGLSDSIARLEASFEVIRGQFGINNPQLESGYFSLRNELFRMQDEDPSTPDDPSDTNWRTELKRHYVADLWQVPEFRRFCRPFAPESVGAQPGLVIPFSTTITFGLNFFGWPLSGGDSAYDPTLFATKINAVGVQFDGYDAAGLSKTPRVYLIPVGTDVLRSPTGNTLETREWRIFDQALPVPFPIGQSDLGNAGWIPMNDSLSGAYGEMRRFSSMRAYPTEAFPDLDTATIAANTRLIGRSVWNTRWMLIVPGGTLLFDPNKGIDQFINSVADIRLLLMTYSYSGN